MALDTVSKRFSAMHLGSPWRGLLPIPDGTIGQGDRQHVMFLCSAVLAGAEVVTATLVGQWANVIQLYSSNKRLEIYSSNERLEL